jgi:tRNA-Thr(GGU) m(6)t(6)A37 methyltransferase TsaA
MPTFSVTEIAVARTSLHRRHDAPFQPGAQPGAVPGRIEVHAPFVAGLADLDGFSHIWLLYVFHRNSGYRLSVRPPRGRQRRGLFATRSPDRPSPLGMTCARLVRVEGGVLHVDGIDLLDETPIVDIKPYLSFVDAHPGAALGWVASVQAMAATPVIREDEQP